MQNSLDRIFAGLAHTLRDVVAPTVEDPYIKSQLIAGAELLGNLSTRVEWNSEQLLDISVRVRPILEQAVAGGMGMRGTPVGLLADDAPTAASSNAALLEARDRHLAALREVQRWLESQSGSVGEELDSAIREFLGWQVTREAELLRTGMFSAAKK